MNEDIKFCLNSFKAKMLELERDINFIDEVEPFLNKITIKPDYVFNGIGPGKNNGVSLRLSPLNDRDKGIDLEVTKEKFIIKITDYETFLEEDETTSHENNNYLTISNDSESEEKNNILAKYQKAAKNAPKGIMFYG